MNKCVFCCAVFLCFLSPIRNFSSKIPESTPQVCIKKAIKTFFGRQPLYLVFYNQTPEYMVFELENPKIIINTSTTYKTTNYYPFYNIVIEARNYRSLYHNLMYFVKNDTPERKRHARNGKYLIITDVEEFGRKIIDITWKGSTIYIAVLVINGKSAEKSRIFTADPHGMGNQCAQSAMVFQIQDCSGPITNAMPSPMRNYNRCPGFIRRMKEPFSIFDPKLFTVQIASEILNLNVTVDEEMPKDVMESHIVSQLSYLTRRTSNNYTSSRVFLWETLIFLVPPTPAISPIEALIVLFDWEVWVLVFVAFASFTLVWYFLSKGTDLTEIVLHACRITLCGSAVQIPESSVLKILIMSYIIYAIHIQTAYLSNLTRVIINPPKELPINNWLNLVSSSYEFHMTNGMVKEYAVCIEKGYEINLRPNTFRYTIVEDISIRELLTRFAKDGNFCMPITINNLKTLQLELRLPTPNYFIDTTVTPTRWAVFKNYWNYYFIDSLNEVIDRLSESGLYEKLDMDRRFYEANEKRKFTAEEEVIALSFKHLSGVFIIYIFCVGLSVAVFIGELVIYYSRP